MTKPTQAQIEAEQLLVELRIPCRKHTQYTKAMYSHAAEVIEKLLAALTAAAEVGEQDASRIINETGARLYVLENENERLRNKWNAVEEAVMSIDHQEYSTHKTHLWLEGFSCGKVAAAAAIRALKDQP